MSQRPHFVPFGSICPRVSTRRSVHSGGRHRFPFDRCYHFNCALLWNETPSVGGGDFFWSTSSSCTARLVGEAEKGRLKTMRALRGLASVSELTLSYLNVTLLRSTKNSDTPGAGEKHKLLVVTCVFRESVWSSLNVLCLTERSKNPKLLKALGY